MGKIKEEKYNFFNSISLLLAFLLLIISLCYYSTEKSLIFKSSLGNYTFFLNDCSSNAQIVTVPASCAKKELLRLKGIKGQCLCIDYSLFSKEKCEEYVALQISALNATFLFCEKGSWGESFYYYSPKLANFVIINKKKVNLHVVLNEKSMTVGYPLIFSSF